VSAHQQQQETRAWGGAELARAKALRGEGYVFSTIALLLCREFGTDRSPTAVQKLFIKLRQRGELIEAVSEADRQAARERAAEMGTTRTVLRRCLRCRHSFSSYGAENRVCADCKKSDAWR